MHQIAHNQQPQGSQPGGGFRPNPGHLRQGGLGREANRGAVAPTLCRTGRHQPQPWRSHRQNLPAAATQIVQELPQLPHQRLAARQGQGAVAAEVAGQGGQLLELEGLQPCHRSGEGGANEAAEAVLPSLEVTKAGFGLQATGQLQGRAPGIDSLQGGGPCQSLGIDGGRMSCSQNCSA